MNSRETILRQLPTPAGNSITISENQSVTDIMAVIAYAHKRNAAFYDRIAMNFWGGNVPITCENLWDFCKQSIPYKVESEDLQTVKTPQRILSDAKKGGGHDCKHYASFIGGVLDALRRQGKKIDWFYRFAGYSVLDPLPGHVFIVVSYQGGEIWIDPVLDEYDYHKGFINKVDRKVQSPVGSGINGIQLMSRGVNLGMVGATTSTGSTAGTVQVIGGVICALAPAVALVVPVGTVIAAAMVAVGAVMTLIGKIIKQYATSTQQRWLTVAYQYWILGDSSATNDHSAVNEKYTNQAQAWFGVALGVPVYDKLRLQALRGTSDTTGKPIPGITLDQRVAKYRAFGTTENAVPQSAVVLACNIAATMPETDPPGAWRTYAPANIILTKGIGVDLAAKQALGVLTDQSVLSVVQNPSSLVSKLPLVGEFLPAGTTDAQVGMFLGLAAGAYLLSTEI